MKVLCLGGSGGMGRYTTKAIVNFKELEAITIADLNKDAAEDFFSAYQELEEFNEGLDISRSWEI